MSETKEGGGEGVVGEALVDNVYPAALTTPIRPRRASLSSSPLAQPKALIHMLASRVQDYLYFPSPEPLYVVLGTVAANMMKGSPVWVVLIGPPSSGRTILLEALGGLAYDPSLAHNDPGKRIHIVGAMKSPSSLLSGVSKKETSKSATGGLLKSIGPRGLMVMKDFTSMLSMPREPLKEMIGALREIFDGRYSRPLGTDGGRVIEWRGRIGFLAASTPALDAHSAMIGDLGERWIYYRYPETDGYGETMKALGIDDPAAMMQDLRDLIEAFVDGLGLTWEDGGSERRALHKEEKERLFAMASFTCAARSGVPRDQWKGDEVSDVASREAPPRIAGELGQLYLGLEKIGLEADERWKIIGKIAFDSVRQTRMRIINVLRESRSPVKPGDIAKGIGCGRRTVDLLLGDLEIQGVIERRGKTVNRMNTEEGAQGGYVLSQWSKRQIALGWGG